MGVEDAWPLLGRRAELARVVAGIRADTTTAVVLTGPAGSGKTRLAREALRSLDPGTTTEWLVATPATREVALGAVAPLLPALGPVEDPAGLLNRARRAVVDRADGRLVVAVDDAQLLDDTSALLLLQLATRREVVVVATIRVGEPVPEGVELLRRDPDTVSVALGPLDRAASDELVARALGGPVAPAALDRIWERTTGSPLLLRELVLAVHDARHLVQHDGMWSWDGPLVPGHRLQALVAHRLGRLDDEERDLVELLAVGEPLPIALVEELVEPTVVARLERRGLVVATTSAAGPVLHLEHPIHAEVLRAGLPTLAARDLRRRLAAASAVRTDEDAVRVAVWSLDAGQPPPPGVALRAANVLVARDPDLAHRCAVAALEADPSCASEAHELAATARYFQGRFDEVSHHLAHVDPAELPPALARDHPFFHASHLGGGWARRLRARRSSPRPSRRPPRTTAASSCWPSWPGPGCSGASSPRPRRSATSCRSRRTAPVSGC